MFKIIGWINKKKKGVMNKVKQYQLRWFIMVSAKPIVKITRNFALKFQEKRYSAR